ncbi:hypothetical protein TNCV_1411531 [Trichonephila clavipes]|nr:hypothetical protein TNCV_1411531 [Trichonephila clavipes]
MVPRKLVVMKFRRNQYGQIHECTLRDYGKLNVSALYDEMVEQNVGQRKYYEAVALNWMKMQVSSNVGNHLISMKFLQRSIQLM